MIDNKTVFYQGFQGKIKKEFTHDDLLFVVYQIADNNQLYLTGDKYDWEVGLQYVEEIGHLAQVYYLDDNTRRSIEQELKNL